MLLPGRFLSAALTVATLAVASCRSAGAPPVGPASLGFDAAAELAGSGDAAAVSANAHVLLDVIGGRMSGQPSGARAERFGLERFATYGLEDVRLEPFPLLGWERGSASVTVEAPAELAGHALRVLSLGHVGTTEVVAAVVDVGYGTAEELAALDERIHGRIALVRMGGPSGAGRALHRSEKIELAAARGAVGFILISGESGTLIQVGVAAGGAEAPIPALAADFETGDWLARVTTAAAEPVVVRLTTANRLGPAEAANVLGDLHGTSGEWILVGAHLDSWDIGTGALDNGSGTLVVLEAARLLAARVRRGERPLRGIRFALWMGEELGLYGSRHHVERARDADALEEYRAVVNLDMVGAPEAFGALGRPEAVPLLRPLAHELRARGIAIDTAVVIGGGIHSDHQPFLLEGIPIVYLASRWPEGAGRFYHTAGDTRDKIDEPELAGSAAVVAALLWRLASAPRLPLPRWSPSETATWLERMGFRENLERVGEWRW